jgi:putative hydrolase
LKKVDLHVHTSYTEGECSPSEVLNEAEKKKIRIVGFTDHVRKSSDWFEKYKEEIMNLKKNKRKVVSLLGIEARILDRFGNIDATTKMINASELVLGVVHRWPFQTLTNLKERYTELLINTIKKGKINVLGHPTYLLGKRLDLSNKQIERLADAAFQHSVAIEINSSKRVPTENFVYICYEKGVNFSIGSDAHKKEEIGDVDWSIDLLERLGIDEKHIIKLKTLT